MKQLIEKFERDFTSFSDQALVERFNREVSNQGWVSARACFLEALKNQFDQRGIDYSIIKNKTGGFILTNRVVLCGGKLRVSS